MIKKTKEYDLFKFRDDNREKIDNTHVKRLIKSIESRNLLDIRPIIVNSKMEVIDGQHRLLAAKHLNVEIYYQEEKKIDPSDIIKMNTNKSWGLADYFNFYCYHGYQEYIKLKEFLKNNGLRLQVGMNIALGQSRQIYSDFKNGEFKFNQDILGTELDICWETINYIKKMNGYSFYTSSSRFWKALLKIVKHKNFDESRWRNNIRKMVDHFCPKARSDDYLKMMQNIYNWHNPEKINFIECE